ncbi:hypothetical protein ccrud_01835 [Corynebacterium crudilactis]|uniref:Uncharacterized protein n=1 Tax=Corynebacterium crudilactis TaxID=1652495 RepID=A0A172QWZ7_9CORY|nr:hypothetical protein ccrud_01835 [Corynebacterium crudilactis]
MLLVGAGALSLFALKSVKESDKNEGFSTTKAASVEQISAETTEEAAEEVSAEISESEETSAEQALLPLVAPQRQIAQFANLAVRSQVGTCTDPGTLEISTDGGQAWSASESFAATTATQVLRLIPVSTSNIFVVALNADCEPRIYGTADQGATWQQPVSAVGTWYLDPSNPTQLPAPGGAKAISCEAISIAPRTNSNVDALCADGSLTSTSDGGATWSDPVAGDGVLNVAHSNSDRLLITQSPDQCSGVQLSANVPVAEGATCVHAELGESDAGQIAATQFGDSILAWVGETQFISKDGGQTWQ